MTHCAISFVGVISLVGRLSGNPIPFDANLNTTDRSAHAHVLDFSIAACILRAYSDSNADCYLQFLVRGQREAVRALVAGDAHVQAGPHTGTGMPAAAELSE